MHGLRSTAQNMAQHSSRPASAFVDVGFLVLQLFSMTAGCMACLDSTKALLFKVPGQFQLGSPTWWPTIVQNIFAGKGEPSHILRRSLKGPGEPRVGLAKLRFGAGRATGSTPTAQVTRISQWWPRHQVCLFHAGEHCYLFRYGECGLPCCVCLYNYVAYSFELCCVVLCCMSYYLCLYS